MFRVCDKETGEIIFQTNNIQELSDYLYEKEVAMITAHAADIK